MSDDTQVNQPKNDVQEAEVKQTQTDEKPTPTFNQEDVDRLTHHLSAYSSFDPSNGALNNLISSQNFNIIL